MNPVVYAGTQTWPLPGHTAGSPAGMRLHPILGYVRCHEGTDVSAPNGTPIVAFRPGTVTSAGWNGGYGNAITIDHDNGVSTLYGHLSNMKATVGQKVNAGDIIGYVGSTGLSTGPHLHFEVHVNGTPMNPMGWFGEEKRTACSG